jgi:hypothetical protein
MRFNVVPIVDDGERRVNSLHGSFDCPCRSMAVRTAMRAVDAAPADRRFPEGYA